MEGKHLHILWTNSDPGTSHNMVMMYATNCKLKDWWEEVTVIVWGSTAKYLAEDENIQEKMKTAMNVGVKFSACIGCAKNYGIVEELEALEVESISWEPLLTDILQNNKPLLTV